MHLVGKVEQMIAYLTAKDWESFYSLFTEDLYYKVGANEAVIGARAAEKFLTDFYQIVKPVKHMVRGAWELDGGIVIIEMDVNYTRLADGKTIIVPCCDVYRFEGDLIKEWRVYPDITPIYAK